MSENHNTPVDEILSYINPALLDYTEWLAVGMALKDSGESVSLWDSWSKRDIDRYTAGNCEEKWKSFKGSGKPITTGTLVKFALDHGWKPEKPKADHKPLEWTDTIGGDKNLKVIPHEWIEKTDIPGPQHPPHIELMNYLEALFQSDELVGYVTQSWFNDKAQKHLPQRGVWDRTAGDLIQQLNKSGGDIGKVFGDWNPEVGAWIRFNPLDGYGAKDDNVTDYRYALIESDDIDIEKQYALVQELELPAAAIVFSGGKSIHAIVKIDAPDMAEYRKRVDWLYEVCGRNGLRIDKQNRNPSRLSRMPGITRNGVRQHLIAVNIGKSSYNEWKEWIQDLNDDLPDMESLASVWDNLPPLADELIEGILRQGHKMLLTGPAKAGKSFSLADLSIAIAEGTKWFGWKCTKGKVLYVNLELDRASCLHRFKDMYSARNLPPNHIKNIDIWNLRGSVVPLDKLTPKLIRRSIKKHYTAIIIDPIYKVITGDENSAEQMANFCNQFDKICKELGTAAIYCHHHSKGSQGQKTSKDRSSGSGVFSRDPDTLIDMIELNITSDCRKAIEDSRIREALIKYILEVDPDFEHEHLSNDKLMSQAETLPNQPKHKLPNYLFKTRQEVKLLTGWRIEGTLREFAKPDPVSLFFNFPIHQIDNDDFLKDAKAEGEEPPWAAKRRESSKDKKRKTQASFSTAFDACSFDEKVTVKAMAEYMGITEKSIRNRIKSHPEFNFRNGEVLRDE